MLDSFYHITESSELKKKRSKTYLFGHESQPCFEIFVWDDVTSLSHSVLYPF